MLKSNALLTLISLTERDWATHLHRLSIAGINALTRRDMYAMLPTSEMPVHDSRPRQLLLQRQHRGRDLGARLLLPGCPVLCLVALVEDLAVTAQHSEGQGQDPSRKSWISSGNPIMLKNGTLCRCRQHLCVMT